MLFSDSKVLIEKEYKNPYFFSFKFTKPTGNFLCAHCLQTYEKISPSIIENSRDRRYKNKDYGIKLSEDQSIEVVKYLPVTICILTETEYVDVFRQILQSLYLITDKKPNNINKFIASVEFFKTAFFLANEPIVPPRFFNLNIKIADDFIKLPVETSSKLSVNSTSLAFLIDLIDLKYIITVWEGVVFNYPIFIMSSNEYLLYLIIDAFEQLIYPLKWASTVISILREDTKRLISSPFPIFAGVNNKEYTIEFIKSNSENPIILDIDNKSLFYNFDSFLCECCSRPLLNKLKLIKAYYSVAPDRIFLIDIKGLEENISDQKLLDKARNLITNKDQVSRENDFLELIRSLFLDFFQKLNDTKLFMNKKENEDEFMDQEFVNALEKCEKNDCKMPYFWTNVFDSMSFGDYIMYYEKKDDCPMKKFKNLYKEKNFQSNDIYDYEYSIDISQIDMIQALVSISQEYSPSSSIEAYNKKSFDLLSKEITSALLSQQFFYSEGHKFKSFCDLDSVSESFGDNKKTCKLQKISGSAEIIFHRLFCSENKNFNFFYGEYGVIRTSKVFMVIVNEKNFGQFNKIFETKFVKQDSWQEILLTLLNLLKYRKSTWDIQKIGELLCKLNKLNTKAIPIYYSALIVEELYKNNLESMLLNTKGKLQKLKNDYLFSSRNITPIPRTVSVNSINNKKSLPRIYSA
jgi:DENN (AEX-3) domain